MIPAALLYLAIAWTATGPVVGQFESLRECETVVALARVCSVVEEVSECVPMGRSSSNGQGG